MAAKLPPLMVSVGEEDFLVTTGTTVNDPAIGLFVDLNGDPVRGTLMFSTYPRAMSPPDPQKRLISAINYPFVFAMMQDFNVEIHSVETQQIVQRIQSPLLTGTATITRAPPGTQLCLEPLAQKLLMVPFSQPTPSPQRKKEEIQIARRLAMTSSRIYLSSATSISCIIPTPWVLQADGLLDANQVDEALALADQATQVMDDLQVDAERLVHPLPIPTTRC